MLFVSIHARAWRATIVRGDLGDINIRFNSRPRMAGDGILHIADHAFKFQFTLYRAF